MPVVTTIIKDPRGGPDHVGTYDDGPHIYRIDGEIRPGVTSIIKSAGFNPYDKVNAQDMENARIRGKAVHAATHYLDDGTLNMATLDPMIKPYLDAYIRFKTETGFVPRLIETALYSVEYGYAGTIDRLGTLFDHWSIVDLKTSIIAAKSSRLQLAGYYLLARPLVPAAAKLLRYSLALNADGSYKLFGPMEDTAVDVEAFVGCLKVHNWKQKNLNGRN